MKLVGFYVDGGTVVSPTIFRKIALEAIKNFNLGLVIPASITERPDVIGIVKEEELITT